MVQTHSNTGTSSTDGKWVRRPGQALICESCGRLISSGDLHLWFPWAPGRTHRVACQRCAERVGVDPSTPVLVRRQIEQARTQFRRFMGKGGFAAQQQRMYWQGQMDALRQLLKEVA